MFYIGVEQVNILIFSFINVKVILDEIFFCIRTSTKIIVS